MRYLIIDKRQRVETENQYPYAVSRIIEEIEKAGNTYDFHYNNELEINLNRDSAQILIAGKDILGYEKIILRGFSLHNNHEYELYQYIAKHIMFHNIKNPNKTIKLLNQNAILNLPFYNKIFFGLFCIQNNLPYFSSKYKLDGDYVNEIKKSIQSSPLIMKEYSGANDLRTINGIDKIKKNVYKIEKLSDFEDENLKSKDLKNFFIQEFSNKAEDYRLFVANKKVIGGWKRHSKDSFLTVSKGIYSNYNNPPIKMSLLAEKLATLLNADFIAVDFMYTSDSFLAIQEFSLHPGFKAFETKIPDNDLNIAKIIVDL